jgi:hypothetical protein
VPHETQQSAFAYQQRPEQPKTPISTQQSTLTTQESEDEPKEQLTTPEQKTEEEDAKTKIPTEDTDTEFTIQRSISDPEELQRVQRLELRREQERKERLKKFQEEQLKLIQEENERRLKERQEEDKRDEERRLKLQEELRKIQEEKEKRRKQREEEQLRLIQERKEMLLKLQQDVKLKLIQEKEQQKKEEEEKQLGTIEQKDNGEKQQEEQSLTSVIYAQPTPATKQFPQEIILQPSRNEQRPRQRARIVEESDPSASSEQLLLQNERQKLYYQLKEAQQQQERKQQASDQKHQIQELPQRPAQTKTDQHSAHQSKLSQLEKQLHQKQLQEQLQKQFQLQLLQRQDLLRQLKLAVSNAATPTNEDQIVPGPIAISKGNTSAQLFLANGQKIQVVQSPRQGRPLTDTVPGNESPATSSVSTTTQRPPRALLEELTKGVLPPGADFEVIRHKQDGALEDVGKQLPQNLPQKKVTFVFLEEQEDGSYKVKGVKGSNMGQTEGDQTTAGDVESIIKKLEEGDIKLPEPSNVPVVKQSAVPQLPLSLPPTVSQTYLTHSTANPFPTTSKPNNIIKTVSSNFNIQPHSTTTKPNSILKTVSSNLNFQHNRGMEFLQSVTLPPLYDVDSTVKSKTNKQNIQTDFLTTQLNSPYSVEAHPTGQNAQTLPSARPHQSPGSTKINQQPNISSANIDHNTSQHKHKSITATPYLTITQFPPTTYFPQNKYSPSQVPQYTTLAPKDKLPSQEPFLPTDPSFVNPSQSYASFFASGNIPKQTFQNQQTPTPGIVYANPTTQVPLLTTNTPVQQDVSKQQDIESSEHAHEQRDFQQNVEAPSVKTPTRIAAPSSRDILKESERLVPLEEDGSVEYQTTIEAPMSLAEVLKKEGLYAMARFLRESGLNNMLNDTGKQFHDSEF